MTHTSMTREEILATAKVGGFAIVRMPIADINRLRPEDHAVICVSTWYGGCEIDNKNVIAIEPPPQTLEQRIAELGALVTAKDNRIAELESAGRVDVMHAVSPEAIDEVMGSALVGHFGLRACKHFDGAKPETNKPSGRIEWYGGKSPVVDGVRLSLWLRNESCIADCANMNLNWWHDGKWNDIMSYRVIS